MVVKDGRLHRRLRILFLACYFPPVQGSACVRTWNIAKYLARMDWDVTVVTPHPSVWRYPSDPTTVSMELNREGIKRVLTGYQWRCLFPDALKCWNQGIGWVIGGTCRKIARHFSVDSGIGWINAAESACEALTTNDIDVILATGPPFGAFALAGRLSQRLGCPYVLDYRDPWAVHPDSRHSALRATREVERKLIEGCSAITVVSESLLDGVCARRPKLHVVTNGFDPEEMGEIKAHEFGHFAIVYAGNFYPPKRVITPVMQALRCLKDKDAHNSIEWRFHYYGVHGDHVREEAQRLGIEEKILIHGRVGRTEALSAVRGSSVTVVITSVLEEKADKDRGIVTGKLYESLGLRVPVLLVGPAGADVDGIIEKTGLTRQVTATNIHGMVSFLEELMSSQVPPVRNPDIYAWPNIIRKLDAVLRDAIGKKPMIEAV